MYYGASDKYRDEQESSCHHVLFFLLGERNKFGNLAKKSKVLICRKIGSSKASRNNSKIEIFWKPTV